MATKRYAIETIEAEQEQLTEFTEADIESLEFAPEELEALEAESTESISLENVDPKSIAESLETWIEGEEAYGYEAIANTPFRQSMTGNISSSLSKTANRQLLETFIIIVKHLVAKSVINPKTRGKLQVAVRTGTIAVAQLLTPSVANELTQPFYWMIPLYLPSVLIVLANPIRQQVGVEANEVKEPELFSGDIPMLISTVNRAIPRSNSKKIKITGGKK